MNKVFTLLTAAFACAVASCSPSPQERASPSLLDRAATETSAGSYSGEIRGKELARMRACGLSPKSVAREADKAPAYQSEVMINSYKRALRSALEQSSFDTFADCATERARPEFSKLGGVTAVVATARRPPRQDPRPSYCPNGYLKAKMYSDWTIAKDAIRQECKVGDSLLLPAFASGLIASVCDTSKPISNLNGDAVCTLGVARDLRPQP